MGKGSQHDFHFASTGALSGLAKPAYHSFKPLETRNARGVPSASELYRAVESVLPEARDIDRRMRLLNRLWSDYRFRYVIELAVELHRIFSPHFDHRAKKLITPRAPALERSAHRFEFIARPAGANSQEYAAS